MPDKLEQAIASIKSGNKQLGQQLLAQLLQEQPNNELAWLWMSAAVSEDKRQYCIERVLKINPNNQQAVQALEKLRQIEGGKKQISHSPNLQTQQNENVSSTIPEINSPGTPNLEIKASSNALLGAALSDGVMAGFICAILGVPLPIIAIVTGDGTYAQFGMFWDGILLLFTGVLTGMFFYGRKIGRSSVVALGGAFGGSIAGLATGLVLGYSQQDNFSRLATDEGVTMYMTICGLLPTLGGAILGAATAWIPGLLVRSENGRDRPTMETTTAPPPQQQLDKLDSVGERFKQRLKMRFIVAAVSVAIVLACSLCQSLVN